MVQSALSVEVYEFRIYHMKSAEHAQKWDAWMEAAGVKEFKSAGAFKVGAFKARPMESEEDHRRYLVAAYSSMGDVGKAEAESGVEPTGDEVIEAFLNPGAKDPIFERVESSLLTAFPGFPKLQDPEGEGTGERFFEIRTYENPSERAAALKVEMFGKGGEIAIFDSVGLNSVFYGSARIAGNSPQLTYMVAHENESAMDKAWEGFRTSPDWDKLKKNPRYKGTVSKIHKFFMEALPFSELK